MEDDFPKYRIVFMGTPEFAVPHLQALLKGPDEVVAVVTRPDKPKGRGRKPDSPPVKATAEEAGIEVLQPERLPEIRERLQELAPDFLVVVAYGKILKPWCLQVPKLVPVNVHGSLLPELRGAAPIQWAIIRGHQTTGVTVMKMDEGMDTGPIILQRAMDIREEDDAHTLGHRMSLLGAQALMDALDMYRRGEVRLESQGDKATYAPMIKKEDGHIDWNLSPEELHRFVRGMSPRPGAYVFVHGKPLRVLALQEEASPHLPPLQRKAAENRPGMVLGHDRKLGPIVACGRESDRAVILTMVHPAGSKPMSGGAYVNGKAPPVGTVLD